MNSDWGEVVTRYPYRKVRMDHLLSKEKRKEYLYFFFLFVVLRALRLRACSSGG